MSHLFRARVVVLLGTSLAMLDSAPARACMRYVVDGEVGQRPPDHLTTESGLIRVALAREGNRTTLVLANDVQGAVRAFAVIVPIPARIHKKDIRVLDVDPFAPLDAATAPRVSLVVDPDPCGQAAEGAMQKGRAARAPPMESAGVAASGARARDYGVDVEGHFEVGDYDMALLAAKNAKGLGAWLRRFKYDVPPEVEALMGDYLEHGMRFLVVRVHLKKLVRGEIQRLRPLQIEYRSDELVLPVRMAAVGRDTPSEFLFFALAREGSLAVESHTTLPMSTQQEVPLFVLDELGAVHTEALRRRADEHSEAVALLEFSGPVWSARGLASLMQGGSTWVTRYRMRVPRQTHDDVRLSLSPNRLPFHVEYRAHRPWQPESADLTGLCEAGKEYLTSLKGRLDAQVTALAELTGRDAEAIRARMGPVIVLEPAPEVAAAAELEQEVPTDDRAALASVEEAEAAGWKIGGALLLFLLVLIAFGRWQRSR